MAKLYRIRNGKMISGLAGGLAEYVQLDPSLVRLAFVFLSFFEGLGFWLYLILSIVIPAVPEGVAITPLDPPLLENPQFIKIAGLSLILMGAVSVLTKLDFHFLSWLKFTNLWPVALILVGVFFLVQSLNRE